MQAATISDVIRHSGGYAGEEPETLAGEWAAHDFDALTVRDWLGAGCFDAETAARLREVGLRPEDVAARTDAGLGCYTATVGYKAASGDVTPGEARQLAAL